MVPTDKILSLLDVRRPYMKEPVIDSLVKADQDLRDFLVSDDDSFRITAMLDWERVDNADGLYEIMVVFLRLWLAEKLEGWRSFRKW